MKQVSNSRKVGGGAVRQTVDCERYATPRLLSLLDGVKGEHECRVCRETPSSVNQVLTPFRKSEVCFTGPINGLEFSWDLGVSWVVEAIGHEKSGKGLGEKKRGVLPTKKFADMAVNNVRSGLGGSGSGGCGSSNSGSSSSSSSTSTSVGCLSGGCESGKRCSRCFRGRVRRVDDTSVIRFDLNGDACDGKVSF